MFSGVVNRFFTLQPNEDIYFKHFANYQPVSASQTVQYPGIFYVTDVRLAWISNDPNVSDLILPWAEVKNDQYKTGKKSKYCAVRITSTHTDDDSKNVIYEFYLGKTTTELEIEIENCRNAIKKARQSFHGGEIPSNPSPVTPTPSRGPISATSLSSRASSSTTGSTKTSSYTSSASRSQSILLKSSLEKRKSNLLASDHLLRKEYHDLVEVNNLITSDEFWDTHQHLLTQQECQDIQSLKGISSSLLIEKTDFKNQKKIQINAEIIQEIFILNPIVRKVYQEKVPHELSEDEFWTQYFLSEFFTRDKAHLQGGMGGRGGHQVTTDDMFSRAEEEEKIQQKKLLSSGLTSTSTSVTASSSGGAATVARGAATGGLVGAGAEDRERNISARVAIDVDLTSTYGDYHPPERMEPTDLDITAKRSAVLEKYIRKSASVVSSQTAQETSQGTAPGTGGLAGHKRPYGDWSWSGSQYFSELQPEQTPDYLPLHLHPQSHPSGAKKQLSSSSVPEEHSHSHHHSHGHSHSDHHNHGHSHNDHGHSGHHHHQHHSQPAQESKLSLELNAREISRTLFHAFPSHTLSLEFLKADLKQLASQSEAKNSSFHSASVPGSRHDSSVPSFLSSSAPPDTFSSSRTEQPMAAGAVGIPDDLQKFLLDQYVSISELLRHFYSIISHSGLQQRQRIEKIHAKLDEKLQQLLQKKKALQTTHRPSSTGHPPSSYLDSHPSPVLSTAAAAAVEVNLNQVFRCIKDISELIHRAVSYWEQFLEIASSTS